MKSESPSSTPSIAEGKCIYCAYDLSGLPDGTRCPECGRQSIPEAFRREVQEIFDSPRRLYREALRVFSKHPPGWYWSLDRPGDVGRSFRLAMVNIAVCGAVLLGAWLIANAFTMRKITDTYYDDPQGIAPPLHINRYTTDYNALNARVDTELEEYVPLQSIGELIQARNYRGASNKFVHFRGWHLGNWTGFAFAFALLTTMWLLLTQVGMWTQIRRGLPKYARAGRTIIAAANCESCRLPVQAGVLVLWLAVETAVRLALPDAYRQSLAVIFGVFLPVAGIVVLAFWISPLRSDVTRQFIRSRLHALRMFVMYVLFFPLVFSWGIVGIIVWLIGYPA